MQRYEESGKFVVAVGQGEGEEEAGKVGSS